jgi:purine-binding chemotaxis protein CheW
MTSYVTNYQNPLQSPSKEQLTKLLLFNVGSLVLALPINMVKKVLNYLPVHGSGLGYVGVTHLEDREITVIDLHKKLFHKPLMVDSHTKGYLILARSRSGESFGIWVKQTPTLIDIPLSQMRGLPESYRRSDTLDMASHVVLLSQEEEKTTVFVVDTDRLLLH